MSNSDHLNIKFSKKLTLSNKECKKLFDDANFFTHNYEFYISDFSLDVYKTPSLLSKSLDFMKFTLLLPVYFIGLDFYYFKKHISDKISILKLDKHSNVFKTSYTNTSFQYKCSKLYSDNNNGQLTWKQLADALDDLGK